MKLQLLRNATLILTVNNKTIIIDPFLGQEGSYDPVPNCASSQRNPLVDLPLNEDELHQLIKNTDAVILTHVHNDHWDIAAKELLDKRIILFCQPVNAEAIRELGFTNVIPIDESYTWEGISISRTSGHHGTGKIAEMMGVVSGFVIRNADEVIYIAGDTIWCPEVQQALENFKPTRVVVNASAARFTTGDPVLMTAADLATVCHYAPQAMVYAMHLEAANISTETRAETEEVIAAAGNRDRCFVPNDGDFLF